MPEEIENLESQLDAARNETVQISQSDYAEAMRMAEEIGKVKMAQAISSGLSLSVIRWFASMKESGVYKKIPITNFRGAIIQPSSFEELCEGMGFSHKTVYEHLQNFATLGEQYLEEAQRLGLKVRDFRKLRKALKDAPADKRDEIFAALRSAKDSSEDLKTALDVVCEQLARSKAEKKSLELQIEKLEENSNSLKEDYRAQSKVLEATTKRYDELNENYIRATSPHPSDQEVTRQERNTNARKRIDEQCEGLFFVVSGLATSASVILKDVGVDDETAAYVHERVSMAVKEIAAYLLSAGVDVDLEREFSVDFGIAASNDADRQQ